MRQLWKDWQLFAEETGEEHVPDAGGQEAEDFEALIRGRYKEAFDARVQRILDGRLKNLRQENARLRQDAELLLPEPYDSYYAHYLAAQLLSGSRKQGARPGKKSEKPSLFTVIKERLWKKH